MSMDRKEQYKHKPESVEELRNRRRQEDIELRKAKRTRAQNAKRVRVSECHSEEEEQEYTVDQVKEFTQKLIKKDGDRKAVLRQLRKSFIQGSLLADTFLEVDNGLASLVGILTGTDADLQLDAAWCLTNLAAGTTEHAQAVLTQAGPYLITYLDSNNQPLQDQCAWALGNIAGDSKEHRDTLLAQGVLPPLNKMMQSTMSDVVRSAAFALSNLIRGENADTQKYIELGMLPHLAKHLKYDDDELDMVSEVTWVLVYLASSGKHETELKSAEIPQLLSQLLIKTAQDNPEEFQVLTPCLRCLGNLCSGPEEITDSVMTVDGIIPTLASFLQSKHHHIKKESLWALSNMTCSKAVCDNIVSQNVVPNIVQLVSSTFDIKTEAAYCLCNIVSQGPDYCQHVMDAGAMKPMVALLKSTDPECVRLALAFTEMALRMTEKGVHTFEECGGLDGLEVLEYHSNDTLRTMTNDLLEKYFYKEDQGAGGDNKGSPEATTSKAQLEGAPMEV